MVETSIGKPYEEYNNVFHKLRVFSEEVNSDELVWHRDKEDRLIEVVSGEEWMFQFDNELPFEMKPGMVFDIPKETYHRIIKGFGILRLKIFE